MIENVGWNSSSSYRVTMIPFSWLWCFALAYCNIPKLTRLATSFDMCSISCKTTVLMPLGNWQYNVINPIPATGISHAFPMEMVSLSPFALYEQESFLSQNMCTNVPQSRRTLVVQVELLNTIYICLISQVLRS